MATLTVYASGESGYLQASDATYLTAARGDGSIQGFATSAESFAGQLYSAGTHYIVQGFLTWDTSAVGTDTVSNVDFEVDGALDQSVTDFVLEGYEYDWGTTLTTADYRDSDSGIPALGSIISSYDTSGGWDTGTGYNNDLGALTAFNSAINGAGDTLVVVISDRHGSETTPTTGEYVSFECTGNTNDARLTITHAPSVTLTYLAPDADVTTTGWSVV